MCYDECKIFGTEKSMIFAKHWAGAFSSIVILVLLNLSSSACHPTVSRKNQPLSLKSQAPNSHVVVKGVASPECLQQGRSAVLQRYGDCEALRDILQMTLPFDCEEASLVPSLDGPMTSSVPIMNVMTEAVKNLPWRFAKDSVDFITPYCRNDSDYYGQFCMAGDIESAKDLYNSTDLFKTLPLALGALAKEIRSKNKVNFVDVVRPLFPDTLEGKRKAVLLAGFIGLDNNATQFNRLQADLLKFNRYDDYAAMFPYTEGFAAFPSKNFESVGVDFMNVTFATRTGVAMFPGLQPNSTQTYKGYAGVYLGCKFAMQKYSKQLILSEAYSIGYSYQAIKIATSLGKPLKELKSDIAQYDKQGKITGEMMRAGAEYGYDLCSESVVP